MPEVPPARSRAIRSARSIGRPRADARRRERPPREEILFHAARLFASRGVAATTTREIAAAAGLRQPSLFHWFAGKEAILEALLASSLEPSLGFAEAVAATRARPSVRLFSIIRFDARHLAAYPFDLGAWLSPEARAPRYRRLWSDRERLVAIVHETVRAGVRARELATGDAELASQAIFGMVEASLLWTRGGAWTPEAVGDALARLALRSLLRDPAALEAIVRDADDAAQSRSGTSARRRGSRR